MPSKNAPAPQPAPQDPSVNVTKTEFRARAEATYAAILDEITSDPIQRRQFDLEIGMAEAGARRFWESQNRIRPHTDARTGGLTAGHESQTKAGQKLVKNAVVLVAEGIRQFIAKADTGKPGKRHATVGILRLLSPEEYAAIALRTGIDRAAQQERLTACAIIIGGVISDEVRVREAEKLAPDLIRNIERGFKTSNPTHRRRVFAACIQRAGLHDQLRAGLSTQERMRLGRLLQDIMIETTGLFSVQDESAASRRKETSAPKIWTLSPSASEWITKHDANAQFANPVWQPLVVPPRLWRSFRSGGYHYSMSGRIPLIRDFEWRKAHSRISLEKAPLVFHAINTVQATRWRINREVLDAMQLAAGEAAEIGGLPSREADVPPPPPAGIPKEREQRDEAQQKLLSDWKRRAKAVHSANIRLASRKGMLMRTMITAQEHRDDEAIYFAHYLDFRGRMYAACDALSPQGHEWQRALLHFADAVPLGPQGAEWLAVHGANCMGTDPTTGEKLDKAPLNRRVEWVTQNAQRIAAVELHSNDTWWQKADSPWMFYAFCREWREVLKEWEFEGKPDAFKSRIPVSMDGTCNGLQHFSAMLRDEVGGAATNLIPSAKPADIYTEVQQLCMKEVVKAAKRGNELATWWRDSAHLDRGMIKRPVMTMPYGSKRFGITEQLLEELRGRGNGGPQDDATFHRCSYMSGVVWTALGRVVVKAREMMDWLQAVAKCHCAAGVPMRWTVPTGFEVSNDYRESTSQRVKLKVLGRNISIGNIVTHTPKLDARASANAVSPNFVHSYDAAAQCLFISEAVALGIKHFASVHDSFGTHAGKAWELYSSIRSSFVILYSETDVVQRLLEEIKHRLPANDYELLKESAPRPGNLDITGVLTSDYFFS